MKHSNSLVTSKVNLKMMRRVNLRTKAVKIVIEVRREQKRSKVRLSLFLRNLKKTIIIHQTKKEQSNLLNRLKINLKKTKTVKSILSFSLVESGMKSSQTPEKASLTQPKKDCLFKVSVNK